MQNHLTFIDMFAGIGGFHSGMEKAGYKCVGWIEWDKYARMSYQAIYDTEGIYNAKDIQEVSGRDLPDANVWCFGSPCTNISVAGNQKGLGGEQSRMFFEVIRLLKERTANSQTLPGYLLMENVKNLLSSNGGWDFARVQIEMDKAGYDVEWNVFNSAEVVPQNRERVYIVGHLRGTSTRQVFPIIRQSGTTTEKSEIKVIGNTSRTGYRSHDVVSDKGVAKTLTAAEGIKVHSMVGVHNTGINIVGNISRTGHHSDDVMSEDGISKTITAQNAYKHTPKVAVHQVGQLRKTTSFGGNPQTGRVYGTDGVAPTLNTMQGGGREPKILVKPCLTPDRINKQQNGRRFKGDGDPSFTLTTDDRQGIMIKKVLGSTQKHRAKTDGTYSPAPIRIRKLTPLECWRLQGFEDEQFSKAKQAGISNSQLYKQAGNAVTVPVVEAIAERMRIAK